MLRNIGLATVFGLGLAGCGLSNPTDLAYCNTTMLAAVNTKCTGADTAATFDCTALTSSNVDKMEKADVDVCANNVKQAADCTSAKAVQCTIAHTTK